MRYVIFNGEPCELDNDNSCLTGCRTGWRGNGVTQNDGESIDDVVEQQNAAYGTTEEEVRSRFLEAKAEEEEEDNY